MRKLIFWGILCLQTGLYAQFFDDFSGSRLTWAGDTSEFIIDPDGLLQLNSTGSGVAQLWRAVEKMDTAIWQGNVVLDFPPSNANQLEIWFIRDSVEIEDGLLMRLGESGSEDSLRVIEVDNGHEKPLSALHHPIFSSGTIDFNFKLLKDENSFGLVIFNAADTVNAIFDLDIARPANFYFLIKCKYTSTRSDKFFFDDLGVGQLPLDTIPPIIEDVEVIDSQQVIVYFSERVINTSETLIRMKPSLGDIDIIENNELNAWHLIFKEAMENGGKYNLKLEDVLDKAGNRTDSLHWQLHYVRPSRPGPYDIVIHEIMADPTPARALPPCEYVELYNRTREFFRLADLTIADESGQVFLPDSLLHPGEYVILTDDDCGGALEPFGRVIPVEDLPNFNNDGDHVQLVDLAGRIIHDVDYDRNWYRPSDRSQGGWSLEMIHPDEVCKDASNWRAADRDRCGTPGGPNSVTPEDPEPPSLSLEQALAVEEDVLELDFDRRVDLSDKRHIQISPHLEISQTRLDGDKVDIYFAKALREGQRYEMVIDEVEDCQGIIHRGPFHSDFYLPRKADSGEVVINEVLFDPLSGGTDFVEIRNISQEYLKVSGPCLEVSHEDDTRFACWQGDVILPPDGHLAFTEDTATLRDHYTCGHLMLFDHPGLPTEGSAVELFYHSFGFRRRLDRIKYREDWHSPVLEETEGVSLEKMRPRDSGTDRNNWHSASSVQGYATPGSRNSVDMATEVGGEDLMELPWDVFSPDGDGFRDWVEFHIFPEQEGYQLRLEVFDLKGRYLRRLASNALIGDAGIFIWDGTDDNGGLQPIGVYLVLAEMAHPDGQLVREKCTVVIN